MVEPESSGLARLGSWFESDLRSKERSLRRRWQWACHCCQPEPKCRLPVSGEPACNRDDG